MQQDRQDGGDGVDGRDGINGNRNLVEKRDESCLVSNQKLGESEQGAFKKSLKEFRRFITSNQYNEQQFKSGELGTSGGDASKGGRGGNGGKRGYIKFYKMNFEDRKNTLSNEINFKREDGQRGKDGTAGKVGQGGKNGVIYMGTYIKVDTSDISVVQKIAGASSLMATTGAGIGLIGGPIGATVGAVVGGTAGFIAPILGTFADQYIEEGWVKNKTPKAQHFPAYAENGMVPISTNSEGIVSPKDPTEIKKEFIKDKWVEYYGRNESE